MKSNSFMKDSHRGTEARRKKAINQNLDLELDIAGRLWSTSVTPRLCGNCQRLRRIDSRPALIVSSEVEKEKRTWPWPWGPNTTPGTVATCARLSRSSAASRLSRLMLLT